MNVEKLKNELSIYPDFRFEQASNFIFDKFIDDWSQATTLPKKIREQLSKNIPLKIKGECLKSDDQKTWKASIQLQDGLKIESVLMRHDKKRNTVCVSTQAGCSVGCKFCATGKMGFKRDLSPSEIIDQVLFFARNDKDEDITNVVFMGMGEPFLNYENTIKAIRILNNEKYFNIGARNISVSTVGIIEGIKKFTEEDLQVNLAISLHAPNNKLRSSLIPINKKYPIEKLMEAVDFYTEKTKRKVMIEYLFLKGVNDSRKEAYELADLLKNKLCFVNLIEYNYTGMFKNSSEGRMENFKKILNKRGVQSGIRKSFGKDIEGACGQLVT